VVSTQADALPDDAGLLKAMLIAERLESERLRQIIHEFQRHRFGRRAESLPADQLQLALEEVEQSAAEDEAGAEAKDLERGKSRAASRRRNRGSLPTHLPRIEQVVDIAEKSCPCCFRHLGRKLFGMAPGLDLPHVVALFPNGPLAIEG
jgi:transposase